MTLHHYPYDILREIIVYTYVYKLIVPCEEAQLDLQVLSPPVPASHVCRSWRRALLSDPTVWTCLLIPEMKPDGIVELLRRSDSSLLNVFLTLDGNELKCDRMRNMLAALFGQIHRFKILRVDIAYRNDVSLDTPSMDFLRKSTEQVLSYLQQPAPKLQTFSFYYGYLTVDEDFSPDYGLLGNLFSGEAPNLNRIHHRLSLELVEAYTPVFHNLSEIYLNLINGMGFRPFVNFLGALSPRLRLLHIHVFAEPILDDIHIWDMNLPVPFDGSASLPGLERLVINANYMSEFVAMFLKHVALPSNLKWYIMTMHRTDFEDSLPLLNLLSQTRFTYLQIKIADFVKFSFEEKPIRNVNQSDANGFVYGYEEIDDLTDIWDQLIRLVDLSHITRMSVNIDEECGDIFPIIFNSMTNLRHLRIRQGRAYNVYQQETASSCLIALMKALGNDEYMEDPEYDLDTTNHAQQSVPSDIISSHDSDSSTSNKPAFRFPCPLLAEVTVQLRNLLEGIQLEALFICAEIRRMEGYPLRMLVRCPEMAESVRRVIEVVPNEDVQISVFPA